MSAGEVQARLQSRGRVYVLLISVVIGTILVGTLRLTIGSRGGRPSSIATGGPGSSEGLRTGEQTLGPEASPGDGGPSQTSGPGRRGGARGAGAAAGSALPGVKLGATDRGVNADSITMGVLIGEVGSAGGAIGFNLDEFNADREERAYSAYIGDINAKGGILGRAIKPIYRRFDVLKGEARAACLDLTQDKKVFAVFNFGFFSQAVVLCVTKENRTPLVKGAPESGEDIFEASEGYLSSTIPPHHRMNRNLGWELHRMGVLQGKKIGVTASDAARSEGEAIIAVLRGAGYGIEHVSWFSGSLQTAQSQVPGEVLEMKRKGVQVVIMVTSFVQNTSFVQHAESQQFFPLYAVNDVAGNHEDVTTQGMPRSFEPAIAITFDRHSEWRTNIPESATDRACRELYERASGEALAPSQDTPRYVVSFICDEVSRFRDAALIVGTNLTRDRLSTGIQALGERPIPFTGGGSYKVGKFDGADFVRTKRWRFDCRCFYVTEDFRRARF